MNTEHVNMKTKKFKDQITSHVFASAIYAVLMWVVGEKLSGLVMRVTENKILSGIVFIAIIILTIINLKLAINRWTKRHNDSVIRDINEFTEFLISSKYTDSEGIHEMLSVMDKHTEIKDDTNDNGA